MHRLLLLRHGVTAHTGHRLSGWLPGLDLTAEGRAQARALAARLADVPLDALYASPLERCQQTAEEIAEPRGLKVRTIDEVGEVRYGHWTGRSLEELTGEDLWKVVRAAPSQVRFPDGETLYEVQVRAVVAIERLRVEHPRQTVAVCTHADVIKLLVAHYLGMPLDLYHRLAVAPASVTAIGFGLVPHLLRLNDIGGSGDLLPAPEGPEGSGEPQGGADAQP
jgi:probable phosphomutase (TIGR03848 family)